MPKKIGHWRENYVTYVLPFDIGDVIEISNPKTGEREIITIVMVRITQPEKGVLNHEIHYKDEHNRLHLDRYLKDNFIKFL